MAHTHVSSCVLAILGSFSSGLDVLKKLRERGRRKRTMHTRRKKGSEEDGMRLSRSLRQGPEDIGREYATSVYAAGDGFAIGDARAQASLAEILLKLNTGLVGIISTFLNGEGRKEDMQLDYQALTHLSDRSRVETCRALRQLFKRMTEPKPLPAITSSTEQEQPKRKRHGRTTKVRGPMLARIVIENSSKPAQIAMVKPSERRRKPSSSASSSELSKASPTPSTPPPEYAPEPPPRPVAVRSHTAPAAAKPRRKHSESALLPSQANARSTPRLPTTLSEPDSTAPPLPPPPSSMPPGPPTGAHSNPAAHSTPTLPRRRKLTPTYYSLASDGTRLGEIPLHKWHVPYDFDRMSVLNREAEREGWAAREPGAGTEVEGRRRGWGLRRLFGRK